MPADVSALLSLLQRAGRRRFWIAGVNGGAAGLIAAAAYVALRGVGNIQSAIGAVVIAMVIGATVAVAFARMTRDGIAREIERRATQCKNVIITATELVDRMDAGNSYVSQVVIADAARMAGNLNTNELFPARRPLGRMVGAAVACAAAIILSVAGPSASMAAAAGDGNTAAINRIDVAITPPVYTSRPARTVRDPARIEAIAGSRVQFTVRAQASELSVETLGGKRTISPLEPGVFSVDVPTDADGYVAFEPRASSGATGTRRLVGLSITPDAPPRVRITAPGKDLLFPDASRSVDVTIESSDDFGLASLKLRYTKVSGSGEKFTFTEGDVPVTITRDSARMWHARGTLSLSSFGLSQGDMLVYRGVATDARPGAGASESDAFIIEITAPGGVAAAGFAIDDERDRYGLSQQMVIVKTERLIARRASLSADSLNVEALTIAAEQRAVRAEFVFMMGGEVAEEVLAAAGVTDLDETAEAEAEGDILAGRLANRGRLEMVRAIRSMSRAVMALNANDLTRALADEKAALTYLQGAFARARYILRALTERERLDLSRRLSGSLAGVLRDTRPSPEGAVDADAITLRGALADVASLAGAAELGRNEGVRAAQLAQDVLRVDPSSVALQSVATSLTSSSRAIESRDLSAARRTLGAAASALSASIRAYLPDAPRAARPFELDQLNGALIDALRAPGRQR